MEVGFHADDPKVRQPYHRISRSARSCARCWIIYFKFHENFDEYFTAAVGDIGINLTVRNLRVTGCYRAVRNAI